MNLEIGSRINVPHADAQGIVIGRNTASSSTVIGMLPSEYITLRYVARNGVLVDQTFTLKEVDVANPPQVDVTVLAKQIDALQNDLTRANETIRRMKAARKSKR